MSSCISYVFGHLFKVGASEKKLSKLLSLHKVAAMGREVRDRVRGEVIKGGLVGGGRGSQMVRQPDLSRLSQLCASQSGLTLGNFQSMFQTFICSTQRVGFFNIGLGQLLEKVQGSGSGLGRYASNTQSCLGIPKISGNTRHFELPATG